MPAPWVPPSSLASATVSALLAFLDGVTLTYLQFHLVFTLPLLFVLWRLGPSYGPVRRKRAAVGLAVLVAIAFAYTTPWGSYMIQRGVWWYGDGVVAVRVLQIPLGEFLFFGIQTLIVGFYAHWRGFDPTFVPGDVAWKPAVAGVVVGAAMVVGGLTLVALGDRFLYFGGLVAWVGPVVALQFAVGGGYLVRVPRPWVEATVVPAVYLWTVDRIAIGMGTWTISSRYTLGVAPLGLPVEEALFFLFAGMMSVMGLVLWEWVLDWNDKTGVIERRLPSGLRPVWLTQETASQ